jgi:hypothetical protein
MLALVAHANPGPPSCLAHPIPPSTSAPTQFKRFEERVLPELKDEYPTLRRSQLNEMVFRKWERSEENPLRQARLQGNKGTG